MDRKTVFIIIILILLTGIPMYTGDEKSGIKIVHVIIPLADSENQMIGYVPPGMGNGEDADRNLYWGAMYGFRTVFRKSPDWTVVKKWKNPNDYVIERILFKHIKHDAYILAEAYRGSRMKDAVIDFLTSAAGKLKLQIMIEQGKIIDIGKDAGLIIFAGHNGLLDFTLDKYPQGEKDNKRQAIILGCWSKQYFSDPLKDTGASPLLWSTERIAPEGYILEAAIKAWLSGKSNEVIREAAAKAYNKYQHCGIRAAKRLIVTGY
ncbi:MAG: hypothetical protein JW737_06645 [Acidobacteria bacterium]|nr:hypothetical protein [Acidobacteriota bacterium]